MTCSDALNIDSLLDRIHDVVGPFSLEHPLHLHEPDFRGTHASQYVQECIDTGWVSSSGSFVSRFEDYLCDITGADYAVALTNGTVALRLALHLVGVSPGDEVILPPLSFVATANAVSHLGAVPHFVDVCQNNLGMSPVSLSNRLESISELIDGQLFNRETGRRIAAVLPVHVFGHPADVDQLKRVADSWGLPMVEDAAEALGSFRSGIHCGLFGSIGTLSFNGNKLVTTGGGGALLTNNDSIASRARHLSTTAKQPHPWAFNHDAVGWNDRLPNLNAALGVAQLEDLDRRLASKRQLVKRYQDLFSDLDGVELVLEPDHCRSNFWLVCLRLTAADPSVVHTSQLQLLKYAHATGLFLRPIWTPLHQLPMYASCPAGCLDVADSEACRLINLPSSPQLSEGFSA